MRRAAVIGILVLATTAAVGCDDGAAREGTASARGEGSSGGEARMRRARREMGLADLAIGEDDPDELSFELGPERLPGMPRHVDPAGDALREGLALAAQALAVARPEPEADLDRPGYQTFVEEDYARWLAERGEALGVARRALALALAEEGETGEYAVASAVIGLLFARFAEAIATMPIPVAIESAPTDRLRFRDAFLRAAAPLFDRAADAFGACASASVRSNDSTLGRWRRFCDERLERVQDAPRPMQ